ncbi:MAG: recombination protein RecR [Parcubacteria group bacterium Licking1014_1]|nr:MAG: recombination protein RecR [Parcubacteria group bacterium Licking1014_1]
MDSIQKLIDIFKKFPTIGPRTAHRFVFYLIRQPKEKIDELVGVIENLKKNIRHCNFCFNPFETSSGQDNLCEICKNPSRLRNLLCVVEKESDLIAIENAKKYKGLYFILGGTAGAFKKDENDGLRIEKLKERIKESYRFGLPKIDFQEIIIAINPTLEGKTTSALVERTLKEISLSPAFKITHLANGIPIGGELEYADEETLESAFEGRK